MSGSKTVVVIGGGHAGVEAALSAARTGARAVLVTAEPGAIAVMPCNPAIGGVAKGTLVREVDALGGVMGEAADRATLQFRMLNTRKGPAVWGPRVQADSERYPFLVRQRLKSRGVTVVKGMVVGLAGGPRMYQGAILDDGSILAGDAFVLTPGTYLGGVLFRGGERWPGGRAGGLTSTGLNGFLGKRFHVERFKTGTSPRVVTSTVRLDALELQQAHETPFRFSLDTREPYRLRIPCYLAQTHRATAAAVMENLDRSPLYSGRIAGKGPRYCPSFEDKVVKFPTRDAHPVHLEPVSARSRLSYLNGLSTSMPQDVQYRMLRSMEGFEKAEIAVFGYAVEYTVISWGEFDASLRLRGTENLFAGGQVLGTSGYEEAAALGVLAGANAARTAAGLSPEIPSREESYLGVMVDDLVSKKRDEPYRLFTSRAESRLSLRQDNAHIRMSPLAVRLGLLHGERSKKIAFLEREYEGALKTIRQKGLDVYCRRPDVDRKELLRNCPELGERDPDALNSAIIHMKYEGYVHRQQRRTQASRMHWTLPIPGNYAGIGLSVEAVQALRDQNPGSLGEARLLRGVKAADMEVLVIHALKARCST